MLCRIFNYLLLFRPSRHSCKWKSVSMCKYIYIYIYIYIVIHRQTFSLYHNSSMWLDMQDQNPPNFYVMLCILPLNPQSTYISSGITILYVSALACLHFALPDTKVLNSLEELCIMRVAAINSFARVLNP